MQQDVAKRFWNEHPQVTADQPWIANREIEGALYRRMTGGEPMFWLAWLMQKHFRGRRFARMLSPGCGMGAHEIFVAGTAMVDRIDAFDFSEAALTIARENAAKQDVSVNFYCDDLNSFTLSSGVQYDLVLCSGSVHHVRELERFFDTLRSRMHPEGALILNEYVGPCYNLYPQNQIAIVNRLLRAFAAELRTQEEFVVEPLEHKMRFDPSESVRSALILPLLEQYFTIEMRRDYGGSILHNLYHLLDHARVGAETPESTTIVRLLIEFEQILMDEKILASDFTLCVAKPKQPRPDPVEHRG